SPRKTDPVRVVERLRVPKCVGQLLGPREVQRRKLDFGGEGVLGIGRPAERPNAPARFEEPPRDVGAGVREGAGDDVHQARPRTSGSAAMTSLAIRPRSWGAASAASAWTRAAVAVASGPSIPFDRKAPMIPVRTSPVPAVA